MLDITNRPQVLEIETSPLAVMEYVWGKRFDIVVDSKGVTLRQDETFNQTNFGSLLDLPQIWKSLIDVYRIKQENFLTARFREYVISCIYYDPELCLNKPFQYLEKGIVAVKLEAHGQVVSDSRLAEFCNFLMLPANEPIMVERGTLIRDSFLQIKTRSKYSKENIPAGFVFRNDPPEMFRDNVTGETLYKEWIFKMDAGNAPQLDNEDPTAMAHEYVFRNLKVDVIEALETESKINPVHNKRAYKNLLLNTLAKEFDVSGDFYFEKCKGHLEGKSLKVKRANFDNLVKKEVGNYLDWLLTQDKWQRILPPKKRIK